MNDFRPRYLALVAAMVSTMIVASGCDVSGGGGGGSQAPDPVVVDYPIAYVERSLVVTEDEDEMFTDNILDPIAFNPGARLVYKERASVPANEVIITDVAFAVEPTPDPDNPGAELEATVPLYDVKDLEVNPEGTKLLFAMRAPEIENSEGQPTWNIWEYDIETEMLRRIIDSDLTAEGGHDVAPAYLPDGRIIFSSTRQRRSRAILLDESKPQFSALNEDVSSQALLLHVMDEDGLNIRQISFNQSHDLHPTVLSTGEVMFLRWDNFRDDKDRLSLYKTTPSGSNTQLVYGYHSQNTGTNNSQSAFVQPRELEDGRVMVTLRARETPLAGGDLIAIDVENNIENTVAVDGSASSTAAQVSLSPGVINTDGGASLDGLYSSAYPIADGTGRVLSSWSPCFVEGFALNVHVTANRELIGNQGQFVTRSGDDIAAGTAPVVVTEEEVGVYPCNETNLQLANIQIARPRYGLWIFDAQSNSQSPVVIAEEDKMYTEAVVLEARPIPDFISDPIPGVDFDAELDEENVGIVHIRSIYDVDGSDVSPSGIATTSDPSQTPADQRSARFLRVMKAVSRPSADVLDFDEAAFGNITRMRDILGYVPIEPDGSVMFKAPADVALSFSVVDVSGKRIAPDGGQGTQHENWFSVRPGEVFECKGCHEDEDSQVPHGRLNAGPGSLNLGAQVLAAFPGTTLRDSFGILHTDPPDIGETMAQYYTRLNGIRTLSVNMVDMDDWVDNGTRPQTPVINHSYATLASGEAPVDPDCLNEWNALCRVTINYEKHIQPLWTAPRQTTDDMGVVIADNTCTNCHSPEGPNGTQVPAGQRQLDLSASPSAENMDILASYTNLFQATAVLQLNDQGLLVPELEQEIDEFGNPVFETQQVVVNGVPQFQAQDANGNIVGAPAENTDPNLTLLTDADGNPVPLLEQVLDANGQPIPVLVLSGNTNPRILNTGGTRGAARNTSFFNVFEQGLNINGDASATDHRGFLNSAELKLIAEWLDVGGQYRNNPFPDPEED